MAGGAIQQWAEYYPWYSGDSDDSEDKE